MGNMSLFPTTLCQLCKHIWKHCKRLVFPRNWSWGSVGAQRNVQALTLISRDLLLLYSLVNSVPQWMGWEKENTPGDYCCISQLSFSPCSSPVMLKPSCHSVLYCSYCHGTQGAWHGNQKSTVQAQIRRPSGFQRPYNQGEKPEKTKADKWVDGEQKETRSWCWLGSKNSVQGGDLSFFNT